MLDLQRVVKSGQDQMQVRTWLKKLRAAEDAPQPVLEVKIVNADELRAPDKVISIKRNDTTGEMTGAVVQSVP